MSKVPVLLRRIRDALEMGRECIDSARSRPDEVRDALVEAIGVLALFEYGVPSNEKQLVMAWARAAKRGGDDAARAAEAKDRAAKRKERVLSALATSPASTTDLLRVVQDHNVGCSPSKLAAELAALEREGQIAREGRGRQGGKLWVSRSGARAKRAVSSSAKRAKTSA